MSLDIATQVMESYDQLDRHRFASTNETIVKDNDQIPTKKDNSGCAENNSTVDTQNTITIGKNSVISMARD